MIEHKDLYIGGRWIPSAGSGSIEIVDSATEEVFASVPAGAPADVDAAVAAAAAAFPEWSRTSIDERGEWSVKVAAALRSRAEDIASATTREVGMVHKLSRIIQAGLPAGSFEVVPDVLAAFPWERQIGSSVVVHEPVGVVACITPWNYPLPQAAAKVAFAIAAGCTVVLKPSEVAPLTAYLLAEAIDQAGLPAGVFNLVCGPGPVIGEALAAHPDVDMVSFTGSTRAGKRIAELCSARVARVALELGGKSANVILEGADIEAAVRDGVSKAFLNSGQTCSALTRMVVPRARLAEIEELAVAATEALVVGDPFDSASKLGPLASQAQWDRVQGYIRRGIAEGARVVTGGPGRPPGLDRGYYARATVFSDVTRDMAIAQEEIFGPVLAILPFDDPGEAVEIANDSIYGLGGAVWAADDEQAVAVARRLRTGQVQINAGSFNPVAPFGGFKQSGIGREYGEYGLAEFLEIKALLLR